MAAMKFLRVGIAKAARRLFSIAVVLGYALFTVQGAERADGTTKLVAAPLGQIAAAITNAFSPHHYHGMGLLPSHYQYDTAAHRWSRRPATNEWSLYTVDLPLTTIVIGKKNVPYFAEFDITVREIATNQCDITVRTISAWVHDGKEIGIHGGWAVHSKHIPPVLQEETNVLLRIEIQLHSMQMGDLMPLPPTPDSKDATEYPLKRLIEVNPEASGQNSVSGNCFVAKQPENVSYDSDGNPTQELRVWIDRCE
jgi:hypothetical protein